MSFLYFKIFLQSSVIALLNDRTLWTAWPTQEFFTLKNRKSFKMFPQSSVIALLPKRTLRTAWTVHEFFTLKERKYFEMFPLSSVVALLNERTLRTDWPVHEFFTKREKFHDVSTLLCDCTFDEEDAEDSFTCPEVFTTEKREYFKMFPLFSVIALFTKRMLRTAWPVQEFFTLKKRKISSYFHIAQLLANPS